MTRKPPALHVHVSLWRQAEVFHSTQRRRERSSRSVGTPSALRSITRHMLQHLLLLLLSGLSLGAVIFFMSASHNIHSTRDGGLEVWLQRHPPRKVSHDAELLRRQRLTQLIDLPPEQLAEHVPAILASLDHADYHVRQLAASMLGRLEPPAITAHADGIAEHLLHSDATVRLHIVQAMALVDGAALAAYAERLVDCLSDVDPGVRWAAVDAITALEPKTLAKHALGAIDTLVKSGEVSLARNAVSGWAAKLEQTEPQVMEAINQLNYKLNVGGMDLAMAGGAGGAGRSEAERFEELQRDVHSDLQQATSSSVQQQGEGKDGLKKR